MIDAKRAVVLPDSVSDEQAAMFFVNPITAYVLVREVLAVPRDAWVLVTAAGSALGEKDVVRMGKRDGFRTICVVRSAAHSAELATLGADAVIETDRQDLVAEVARITAGRGVGFALDCVGGRLAGEVVRCLGLGGQVVVYGTLAECAARGSPARDLMMPVAQVRGFLLPNWLAQQSPLKLFGVLRTVPATHGRGHVSHRRGPDLPARGSGRGRRGLARAWKDRQDHASHLTSTGDSRR